MKRIVTLLATIALGATLLVGCGGSKSAFNDGTYVGETEAVKGLLKVEVKVEGGKMTEINVLESSETETIFAAVEENLIPEVIEKNSTEVDTVSGATGSSKSFLEAVNNALESAK